MKKVTLDWLKQYVDFNRSGTETIAHIAQPGLALCAAPR